MELPLQISPLCDKEYPMLTEPIVEWKKHTIPPIANRQRFDQVSLQCINPDITATYAPADELTVERDVSHVAGVPSCALE